MRATLETDDLATVRRLGHSMRGAGASYGFEPLTTIGAALEDGSATLGHDGLRRCLAELTRYLDRVQVVST